MRRVVLVGITLACSAVTAADIDTTKAATKDASDFGALTAQCIGLERAGQQQCMNIIARYKFGPPATPRTLTLAERTALDAIRAADSQAILVLLPDGSYTIGEMLPGDTLANRFYYIPCTANPCPSL